MRIALFAAIFVAACSPATSQVRSPESSPPATSTPAASTASPSAVPRRALGAGTVGAACPITRPNGAPPPEGEAPGGTYLGNGHLWTVLWPKGLVVVPPDAVEPDGGLGMKFPWWRAPDVHGALHIIGYELTLRIPVRAHVPEGYGDTGFQASGIVFPVEGCYEVTGMAGGATLTFVTMVRTCSAIAEMPPSDRARYSLCNR